MNSPGPRHRREPSEAVPVTALRELTLAVSVLEDIDLTPGDDGVLLQGLHPVLVGWDQIRALVGEWAPQDPVARHRVSRWMKIRNLIAGLAGEDHATDCTDVLGPRLRLMALPAGHAQHPGPEWVRGRALGGALECGAGLLGVGEDPDLPVALTEDLAEFARLDLDRRWPELLAHAERMGALAAERLIRDGDPRQQVLRPFGGVDVLSLLLSGALRGHLASTDRSGMRAVAMPTRTRGWFDLARIDPVFVGAAWSATDPDDRGCPTALLVTADEVSPAPRVVDLRHALSDPPPTDQDRPWDGVLFR